jgi:uncharacterized protein (DUF2249 family)
MSHQTVLLDVRKDILSGVAPCSKIKHTASLLNEGDTLQLIAPFEPTPLYDLLGREGFTHRSRALGGGDWEVRFTKNPAEAQPQLDQTGTAAESAACGCGCAPAETVELDLRGLEPPEPMVRVLDALVSLPEGTTLRAVTDRQPLPLLDQLEMRGFNGKITESPEGGYATIIRRR